LGNEKNDMEILEIEHDELQFKSFSNIKALEIGLRLKEIAEKKQLAITIDIERHSQQLFHYALEGTSKDNDQWIKRKNRVVNHFGKSSYYIKKYIEKKNTSLKDLFFLNSEEYSAFGGAFPIFMKDTGIVGTITVSGLPDVEDHNLVVAVIKEFI